MLGIVGLVFTCTYGLGVIAAIVALALAPGANREISTSGGALTGTGMVKAGVICSWISVALTVLGVVLLIVLLVGSSMSDSSSFGAPGGGLQHASAGVLGLVAALPQWRSRSRHPRSVEEFR